MTSTPAVVIAVDGRALGADAQATVAAVDVVGVLDRPSQCWVTAVTDPWRSFPAPAGASLTVRIPDAELSLFEGTVTGVERSWSAERVGTVVVRGHDRLARLRDRPRTEAAEGDVAAVAAEIAGRHGLALQSHAESPHRSVIGRFGETDLAFLRRLAARTGLHFAVRGEVLHLFDSDGIGTPIVLRADHELRSLVVDTRADIEADDIAVHGWQPGTAEVHRVGEGAARPGWVLDEADAPALHRAMVARRRRCMTVANGVADGDPRLRPGSRVRLGPVDRLSDPLLISRVHHLIDDEAGFRTEFTTDPPDPPPSPEPAAWTLGTVVEVEDPEGRGRVRVALAAYCDQQSDWLPVVLPGAGPSKGLVALPDVGDHVVVLGSADDPGRGIVLGGLLGTETAAGSPVVRGRTRRTVLQLPGGGSVRIDDAAGAVVVDNGGGTRLELGRDRSVLHAATDLDIAAPGHRLRLVARAIDMERA